MHGGGASHTFGERKCNYECLKRKSGHQGKQKNSDLNGVMISHPPSLSRHLLWSKREET